MTPAHLNSVIPFSITRLRAFSHLRTLALLSLGVALLTVGARTQVPMWPVPMTLQTLAVLLIGLMHGPRMAMATVLSYLALGSLGAPVFASPAGLMGPTGGFLAGFVLAAGLVAALKPRQPLALLGTMTAASALVLLCGSLWLATFAPAGSSAVYWAVQKGVVLFVPGEALKVALATCIGLMLFRRRSTPAIS